MALRVNQLIGFGARTPLYRFLRLNITKVIYTGSSQLPGYTLQFSPDGGTTVYPTVNMTSDVLPAPLVASNVGNNTSGGAWNLFDGSNTTFNQAGPMFSGQVPPTPMWWQIDLGQGYGITGVNAIKYAGYNTGGIDLSIVDFNVTGSRTGAFAGEQVTLKSWTGQTSKAHQTLTTFT